MAKRQSAGQAVAGCLAVSFLMFTCCGGLFFVTTQFAVHADKEFKKDFAVTKKKRAARTKLTAARRTVWIQQLAEHPAYQSLKDGNAGPELWVHRHVWASLTLDQKAEMSRHSLRLFLNIEAQEPFMDERLFIVDGSDGKRFTTWRPDFGFVGNAN